jgi:hypothetical protein
MLSVDVGRARVRAAWGECGGGRRGNLPVAPVLKVIERINHSELSATLWRLIWRSFC